MISIATIISTVDDNDDDVNEDFDFDDDGGGGGCGGCGDDSDRFYTDSNVLFYYYRFTLLMPLRDNVSFSGDTSLLRSSSCSRLVLLFERLRVDDVFRRNAI